MIGVVLSIKPEYTKKIFSFKKHYELRRQIFKKKEIKRVLIYESFPTKKIVGEFLIENIIYDTPNNIFKNYGEELGIEKEKYDKYFLGKKKAYAIKIGQVKKYENMLELKDLCLKKAPQSFQYINLNLLEGFKD